MNDWLQGTEARRLRADLLWQIDNLRDDRELRNRLEGMAAAPLFKGFSWLWGPRLYARNRAMFRPLLTQHFSDVVIDADGGWRRLDYAGEVAQALDAWLPALEREGEATLFRRVWGWKHRGDNGWGVDERAWRRELARAFAAATPARRPKVLELYAQQGVRLNEDAAWALYTADPALAGPFILRHLPWRGWGREDGKGRWTQLDREARRGGDEAFAWRLYRQQVEAAEWAEEALALCTRVRDAEALCAALDLRHPESVWSDLGAHYVRMMEARGLDVLPYVRKHLRRVYAHRGGGSFAALEALARKRGWVDFWAAVVVTCAPNADYNKALAAVLEDGALDEAERRRRLSLLSGVSREWNGLGWGVATVQQLTADNAVALYRYDARLLAAHFKAHVTPGWNEQYLKLFEAAWAAGDEELADHLASRYATRLHEPRGADKQNDAREAAAEKYLALKLDEAAFARRAAAVLSLVPAFSVWDYDKLIEKNRFARLLFERSLRGFLAVPAAVRDLVEGGEIHVQQLAYRVLGLDDARARVQAAENLDILLGTLLRPLHRRTRLAAFAALENAACSGEEGARRVLAKAREAFALPDQRYPKEALVGMIGRILARFPGLAAVDEKPVVYRRVAA